MHVRKKNQQKILLSGINFGNSFKSMFAIFLKCELHFSSIIKIEREALFS